MLISGTSFFEISKINCNNIWIIAKYEIESNIKTLPREDT